MLPTITQWAHGPNGPDSYGAIHVPNGANMELKTIVEPTRGHWGLIWIQNRVFVLRSSSNSLASLLTLKIRCHIPIWGSVAVAIPWSFQMGS